MAHDDVKRALEAMIADDGVADQMAAGDFSGVAGLDLTPDEQLMVKDAAADLPEVAGFAIDIFAKLGDIKGESADVKYLTGFQSQKVNVAMNYAFKFKGI